MRASLAEVPPLTEPVLFGDEQLPEQPLRPNLYAVPDPVDQHLGAAPATAFVTADRIPELAFARRRAARDLSGILAQNRHVLQTMGPEYVLRPVDALGTARQLVAIEQEFGKDSPEYSEVRKGLILDSERLFVEASGHNDPEHFAEVLQKYDQHDGAFYSHGLQIRAMVKNSLSPLASPEDLGRRGMEFGEEMTYEAIAAMIGRIGLLAVIEQLQAEFSVAVPAGSGDHLEQADVEVITFSLCSDEAIAAHAINPKGAFGGMAPAVEKMMIRRVRFIEGGHRLEEQAAVPGIYITQEIVQEYQAKKAALPVGANPTKTEVLGTQLIGVTDKGNGGVTEVVRELDQMASEKHGLNIYWGKVVPDDHPKDYAEFVEEAQARKERLTPMPEQLAEFLITLEKQGTDGATAEALVGLYLRTTLLEVARKRPELAEHIFDKATAQGFAEVARLEAIGEYQQAQRLQLKVENAAPEVDYCGGGGGGRGCGVEVVSPASLAGQLAISLGLRGTIVHNQEVACPNPSCGAMELHHDMEGNSACVACKSTKLKGQDVKHAEPAAFISLDEKRKEREKARVLH